MLHHDVLQGSRKLQVRGSKLNCNVYNESTASGSSTGHEGICVLLQHADRARLRKGVGKVPLHIDNTATLHVIGNRAYNSRTKHIALRSFYIRELVSEGKITIRYISTEDQLADVGKKSTSIVFNNFTRSRTSNFIDININLCYLHEFVY